MRRRAIPVLTVFLLAVTIDAGAEAPPVSRFQAFEARADSFGVESSAKLLVALPLPVESFSTRTRADINSQPSAVAYAGVVDVPLGELLGFYNVPAKLPTYCYAQYPGEPDATCGSGRTHATGDGFDYDATAAESTVSATEQNSDGVRVGASSSHSVSRIVDGAVRSETEIVLHDVDIAGAIQIEQLRATAWSATAGMPGSASGQASLTASGVTVAGTRIPVPEQLDVASLVADVLTPLGDELRQYGVEVHAVAPPAVELATDGRSARAFVDGMEVSTFEPTTGNRTTYRLAVARTSANAVPTATQLASAPAPSPGVQLATPTAAPGLGNPSNVLASTPLVTTAPAASTALDVPQPVALRPSLLSETLDPRAADWFGRLYLALAATVLVLGAVALRPRHHWRNRVR